MFSYKKCSHEGCSHFALSDFDSDGNIIEGGKFCYAHIENKDEHIQKVYDYIRNHDKIIGLNASGITFTNIDVTNKGFYGCNFSHSLFAGLNSKGIRVRMSIFDFATFSDSNFLECNSHFSSYAGAKFSHVNLTGSDLVQDNFCGLSSFQSSFDDSDLYSSYFINAKLIDTSFRNCNIKETVFYEITQQNVSFRQSNTNAAIFDKRGSALFTGLEELNVPRGVQKGPVL
ncbi:MAG: pentapeptide repeat-containing protein [Treponema sp.]|nr:pentapeptide repeat-containing protein [Treponema sp.]